MAQKRKQEALAQTDGMLVEYLTCSGKRYRTEWWINMRHFSRLARSGLRRLQDKGHTVKFTKYFEFIRQRPDRAILRDEWIERAVKSPVKEIVQKDGRIRRWVSIEEMENRFLRVVILPDGETIHNAFFDRRFKP